MRRCPARSALPLLHRLLPLLLLAASASCAPASSWDRPLTPQEQELIRRSALRRLPDPADLRPEARILLEALREGRDPLAESWSAAPFSFSAPPTTIRVWRRSLGGTESCAGPVEVIPFEQYVRGVLPYEWIPSWKPESLKAGAVAIRTYAAAWVGKGGKYTCADVCDTTYTQVYKDATLPVTDQAAAATAQQVLLKGGELIFAEYSAENGDPTKTGVSDPVCAGKTVNGHGRGMCQWGSQRWALQGKDYRWIALHYFPGAALWEPAVPSPDQGGSPPDGGSTLPDQLLHPDQDLGPMAGWDGGQVSGGCSCAAAGPADQPGLTLLLAALLLGLLSRIALRRPWARRSRGGEPLPQSMLSGHP